MGYTVRIDVDSPKFNDKISNHSCKGDRKLPEIHRSSCPPQQKSNQSPNRTEISDPQLSDEYSGIDIQKREFDGRITYIHTVWYSGYASAIPSTDYYWIERNGCRMIVPP